MTSDYSDPDCRYLGGDPRHDETGEAAVHLQDDGIRIEMPSTTFVIPKGSIQQAFWRQESLGFERAEYEEGVLIDPNESLIRDTVVVVVRDPEGVVPDGLHIRFAFRNEYMAKVFEKRCTQAFALTPPLPF